MQILSFNIPFKVVLASQVGLFCLNVTGPSNYFFIHMVNMLCALWCLVQAEAHLPVQAYLFTLCASTFTDGLSLGYMGGDLHGGWPTYMFSMMLINLLLAPLFLVLGFFELLSRGGSLALSDDGYESLDGPEPSLPQPPMNAPKETMYAPDTDVYVPQQNVVMG